MKYSNKVLIEKERDTTRRTPDAIKTNLYNKTNVNVAQGPRTGNDGSMAKRSSFKTQKDQRAPLADHIARAFAARDPKDHIQSNLEGIEADVKPRKLKRATY